MSKVTFFYLGGTGASLFGVFKEGGFLGALGERMGKAFSVIGEPVFNAIIGLFQPAPKDKDETFAVIPGYGGSDGIWTGAGSDPFTSMLNPDMFDAVFVPYPASILNMGGSLVFGANKVISLINALPAGAPFMLGGTSQGAAAMSHVYNEIRYGSLTSRASSFLGFVGFGNPRRQQDYRGSVGGTWSGCWDIPGSSTGGHGAFAATGGVARLSSCEPEKWIEFVNEDDIFSAVGDSTLGANWCSAVDFFTGLDFSEIGPYILSAGDLWGAFQSAMAMGGVVNEWDDLLGNHVEIGGNGHTRYAMFPPPGDPDDGLSSYQIALKFCHEKAQEWATAPVVLPANSPGWSTTLIPPAA